MSDELDKLYDQVQATNRDVALAQIAYCEASAEVYRAQLERIDEGRAVDSVRGFLAHAKLRQAKAYLDTVNRLYGADLDIWLRASEASDE